MENLSDDEEDPLLKVSVEKEDKFEEIMCEAVIKIGEKLVKMDGKLKDIKNQSDRNIFFKYIWYFIFLLLFLVNFYILVTIYHEMCKTK